MFIAELIRDYLFLTISVILGLIGFRYFNVPFRILVVLVCFSLIISLVGRQIRQAGISNLDLYYWYLLVEALLQWLVALFYFRNRRVSIYLWIAFLMYCALWTFELIQHNFEAFADAHLMECILLVIMYLVILLRSINQPKAVPLRINPYFWLSLSIIIYKAGAIPCWAMFGHLKPDIKTAEQLFLAINNPLTAIQDLLLAISFYLYYRNAKKELMGREGAIVNP